MIGNDVVDLALARTESDWRRRGFLQKMFTENEQLLIANDSNPELMIWNLWSRKEAAYKIYNRQTGIRAFIPLQLECVFENASDGKVKIKDRMYFTKTQLSHQKIHTIAVAQKADFTKVQNPIDIKSIIKIDGIPYLENTENPISISHHGRFEEIVMLK